MLLSVKKMQLIFKRWFRCSRIKSKVGFYCIVVIDKDFTEWKVLKDEFPDVTILFCQWHVIKALFKKVCDLDIPKDKREPLRNLLRALVYSANEMDYVATKT